MSKAELKAEVIDGLQIRTVFKDTILTCKINELSESVWPSCIPVAYSFLENGKSLEYCCQYGSDQWTAWFPTFSKNLVEFSEEQGKLTPNT